MTDQTLKFCDFSGPFIDAIHKLYERHFNISSNEFHTLYQSFINTFEFSGWPDPIHLDRSLYQSKDEHFQTIYLAASIVAADIPSLFSRGDQGKGTVAIVGQDSLSRHPNPGQVKMGTPYALHNKLCREDIWTRIYFQMINELLKQGYRVYLTDLYKIYTDGIKLPKPDRDAFATTLKDELSIIDPVLVVTWGAKSRDAVNAVGLPYQHMSCPHPSSQNNRTWATRLNGQKATNENKLKYWKDAVSQHLG
jgi:hypothetical protein